MTDPNSPIHSLALPSVGKHFTGLTKREEFAKAAMQGLCANPFHKNADDSRIALWAVSQADALIEALNAGNQEKKS